MLSAVRATVLSGQVNDISIVHVLDRYGSRYSQEEILPQKNSPEISPLQF